MGTRTLHITPEVVIALCKHRDTKLVTACTANALPGDAEIVDLHLAPATYHGQIMTDRLVITLRSSEWDGEGGYLPTPVVETFALGGMLGVDDE